jgi:hypothetical protein
MSEIEIFHQLTRLMRAKSEWIPHETKVLALD